MACLLLFVCLFGCGSRQHRPCRPPRPQPDLPRLAQFSWRCRSHVGAAVWPHPHTQLPAGGELSSGALGLVFGQVWHGGFHRLDSARAAGGFEQRQQHSSAAPSLPACY